MSATEANHGGRDDEVDASRAERRWLRVRHKTAYDYDAPVELAQHMAYLSPRTTDHQRVCRWTLEVEPAPDEWLEAAAAGTEPGLLPPGQLSLDAWGNARVAFSHSRVHDRLMVCSGFDAGLLPIAQADPFDSPGWEEVAQSLRYHAGAVRTEAVEFTLPSYYAPRDPALAAFAREAFTPERPLADAAQALMHRVYEEFAYRPLATHVGTRATEALALRRGVCQDFAHVMIGACRSLGLAARYVSGYLLTQPAAGAVRLVGADASHAWAAVWCPVQGWLALDPTNNVAAGVDHVTLAWGRDYADVAPLRGVIRGGGRAEPSVAVTVEPLDR